MTTQSGQGEPNEPVQAVEPSELPAGEDTGAEPNAPEAQAEGEPEAQAEGEPETFPRSYVERLRDEAAEYRRRATDAERLREQLMAATVETVTAGILHSASDLPPSEDWWTEDGPDRDKIMAAAERLAAAKPYLARARGPVGQGARPEPEGGLSLLGILRANAEG